MNIKPFVIGALGVVGHDFCRPSNPGSGSGTLTESNTASQTATTSTSSPTHNEQIVKDNEQLLHTYQRHIELLTKRKKRSRKELQAEQDEIEMEESIYRIIYPDFPPTDNQSTIQRRPNNLI